jgi:hypothetical protein
LIYFLGRRQVVRHRVLVPAFGGSNPPAPAIPCDSIVINGKDESASESQTTFFLNHVPRNQNKENADLMVSGILMI